MKKRDKEFHKIKNEIYKYIDDCIYNGEDYKTYCIVIIPVYASIPSGMFPSKSINMSVRYFHGIKNILIEIGDITTVECFYCISDINDRPDMLDSAKSANKKETETIIRKIKRYVYNYLFHTLADTDVPPKIVYNDIDELSELTDKMGMDQHDYYYMNLSKWNSCEKVIKIKNRDTNKNKSTNLANLLMYLLLSKRNSKRVILEISTMIGEDDYRLEYISLEKITFLETENIVFKYNTNFPIKLNNTWYCSNDEDSLDKCLDTIYNTLYNTFTIIDKISFNKPDISLRYSTIEIQDIGDCLHKFDLEEDGCNYV